MQDRGQHETAQGPNGTVRFAIAGAQRAGAFGEGGALEDRDHLGDIHEDPEHDQDGEQDGRDPRDLADVTSNVGVFLLRPHCQGATGGHVTSCAILIPLACSVGRALFGQHGGLKFGGPRCLGLGEPDGTLEAALGRRTCSRSAVDGPALAGTDTAARALRHGGVLDLLVDDGRRRAVPSAPEDTPGGALDGGRSAQTPRWMAMRPLEIARNRIAVDSGGPVWRRIVDALNSLVAQQGGLIITVLALACVALAVGIAVVARRTARLERRLQGLTRGEDGRSLETILDAHLDKVYDLAADVGSLATRSTLIETRLAYAIQRTGLVRFNPFEDTGGNQSFALALLDARGDGFIVSSLHARGSTRIYAKSVTRGASEAALSLEEAEALRLAASSGPAASAAKQG